MELQPLLKSVASGSALPSGTEMGWPHSRVSQQALTSLSNSLCTRRLEFPYIPCPLLLRLAEGHRNLVRKMCTLSGPISECTSACEKGTAGNHHQFFFFFQCPVFAIRSHAMDPQHRRVRMAPSVSSWMTIKLSPHRPRRHWTTKFYGTFSEETKYKRTYYYFRIIRRLEPSTHRVRIIWHSRQLMFSIMNPNVNESI